MTKDAAPSSQERGERRRPATARLGGAAPNSLAADWKMRSSPLDFANAVSRLPRDAKSPPCNSAKHTAELAGPLASECVAGRLGRLAPRRELPLRMNSEQRVRPSAQSESAEESRLLLLLSLHRTEPRCAAATGQGAGF